MLRHIPEILLHTPEAVDLSRLRSTGVVLYEHGESRLGRLPIGRVDEVRLDTERRKCIAVITFDEEDEEARKIRRKVENGMLRGVSVGGFGSEWTGMREGGSGADGR